MKTSDAIQWAGTARQLAEAIGVRPPAVYQWGEFPPALRQLQIEHLTSGFLKAEPGCLQANAVPEGANE
jgi:DNA-binding transcriptional regulator YdaS (Cro superfamily)